MQKASGGIFRADFNGADAEEILTGRNNPHDLVIDNATETLYWTEGVGSSGSLTGEIWKAGLDGSNPEPVLTGLSDGIRDIIVETYTPQPFFANSFE